MIVNVGRIDPTFRYDFNRIANDEREMFLTYSLVNSRSIPFPATALGLDAQWNVSDFLLLKAGIHQANGRANSASFDKLRGDEIFVPFQATLMPSFANLGDGNYRFLGYYTESGGEQGWGFSLSFDQEIGGGFVPFFRFGMDGSDVADFSRFLSAGLGLEAPFGREDDLVAVGFAWGDPADPESREETIIEAFYRIELNDFTRLTPDVQFLVDPGDNRSTDLIVVFGLRLQVVF